MVFNTSLKAKNLGTRTGKVEFIVLHDTAGSGTANDAKYLANDPEHRGISVDFCVDKQGIVWQLNPDLKRKCTFHAGRKTKFRGRLNGAVNQYSIGIEIAQLAKLKKVNGHYYPEAQIRAVADVCMSICSGFNLTKKDITTHKAIITDGSRSDPREFPWAEFWSYFPSETITNTIVVKGDTLWSLAKHYSITIERLKALNGMNSPETTITVGQTLRVK